MLCAYFFAFLQPTTRLKVRSYSPSPCRFYERKSALTFPLLVRVNAVQLGVALSAETDPKSLVFAHWSFDQPRNVFPSNPFVLGRSCPRSAGTNAAQKNGAGRHTTHQTTTSSYPLPCQCSVLSTFQETQPLPSTTRIQLLKHHKQGWY